MKSPCKIALIGNPNSGKSTLFNALTGLNQKTGNFAGVTIEKKSGFTRINDAELEIIDLPGSYSIYPQSQDEKIVWDVLTQINHTDHPDILVVVVDASNLTRNLLLFTQIYDLGLPTILVLNMMDVAQQQGLDISHHALSAAFGNIPVIPVSAKKEFGIQLLKQTLAKYSAGLPDRITPDKSRKTIINWETHFPFLTENILKSNEKTAYTALLTLCQSDTWQPYFKNKEEKATFIQLHSIYPLKIHARETILRYEKINEIVRQTVNTVQSRRKKAISTQLDRIFLHPIGGYLSLLVILLIMFQSIFSWSTLPMDAIDLSISWLNGQLQSLLPDVWYTQLLTDGIISGVGGVLMFIPQIAFLFFFLTILEETGYMARVMYLMDQVMRMFGLNGKSIVPLFSGAACAIPAIMASRSISSQKERWITIFIVPLISCSARIPVYTIMIALVIPPTYIFRFIHLQGLVLLGLYLLGFVAALTVALFISKNIKTQEPSYFVLEMPDYKTPKWQNIGLSVWQNVYSFVTQAGKIILAISVLLWLFSYLGPEDPRVAAQKRIQKELAGGEIDTTYTNIENIQLSYALEASYAGIFGKFIEPAISPLGFDWKIGIAILTSFAAREVFVGTISTIYALGDEASPTTLKEKLANVKDSQGNPYFNLARGVSILLFYAFALQCMSTMAVVKKETGSWIIPTLQFICFAIISYLSAFLAFQILS